MTKKPKRSVVLATLFIPFLAVLLGFQQITTSGSGFATLAGDLGGTAASPQVISTHITGSTTNVVQKSTATGNMVNSSITDTGGAVSTSSTFEADGISAIGGATNAAVGLYLRSPTLAGTTQWALFIQSTCSSTATVACNAIQAQPVTAAAAFTVAQANGLHIADANVGLNSVITKLVGVEVDTLSQGLSTNLAIETGSNPVSFGGDVRTGGVIANVANTSTMGITLKKGSAGGNYTSASTTYVVVDSTNLCFTVTIPTGWKLGIQAQGNLGTSTAVVAANVALTDNAACGTANAGILTETQAFGNAAGNTESFALGWVISGNGAAHNVALQFKTANAADSALLINSSATFLPTMTFTLMPSN